MEGLCPQGMLRRAEYVPDRYEPDRLWSYSSRVGHRSREGSALRFLWSSGSVGVRIPMVTPTTASVAVALAVKRVQDSAPTGRGTA